MTTRLADPGGHVTDTLVAHYRARALGGVGLVIVERGSPEKGDRHRYRELGVNDDEFNGTGFTKEWGRHLENRSKGQQARPGPRLRLSSALLISRAPGMVVGTRAGASHGPEDAGVFG
jgi:hypothetical protein